MEKAELEMIVAAILTSGFVQVRRTATERNEIVPTMQAILADLRAADAIPSSRRD